MRLICGENPGALKEVEDNSADSIVTDPPYGLKFMGKKWDYDVPGVEIWKECYRVLKPGGYLLSFAGTRTQHRMAINIEDAGFEIRDMIAWVYGSGFPKSHNIGKAVDKLQGNERIPYERPDFVARSNKTEQRKSQVICGEKGKYTKGNSEWEGWGTALKPALEPITVARKPLSEKTVAANVLKHGTGGINIDGCRVDTCDILNGGAYSENKKPDGKWGTMHSYIGSEYNQPLGRFPANLIHDGSQEVLGLFPNSKGQQGDLQGHNKNRKSPNGCFGEMKPAKDHLKRDDSGSAARFFYCAKASKKDRGEGNNHPTVKPTDLMRYLCRLVTPKGGMVVDPFMGSGSTGKAAVLEGFNFIGVDRDPKYVELSRDRITRATFEYMMSE